MRERLTLTAWRKTFGRWAPVEQALSRHPPDVAALLRGQINLLMNRLVANHLAPRLTLKSGVLTAAQRLTAEQLHLGLGLAIRLAERGVNPANTLEQGLLKAAHFLNRAQFHAAVDCALRLAASRIDPRDALEYAMPAAAQNSTVAAEFQASLEALERFLIEAKGHRYPDALRRLAALAGRRPELFRAGLEAAGCLVEHGLNPAKLFDALGAAALTEEQLWAGLDLVTHFARQKMDVSETLQSDLPATAQAVAGPEFLASLEAISSLAEKQLHPGAMLHHGIPAAARATPTDFAANLRALEQFTLKLAASDQHGYSDVLAQLSSTTVTAEQFRAILDFAARPPEHGINANIIIRAALQPVAQACAQPGEIEANLTALEQFVTQLVEQRRFSPSSALAALPPTGLNSPQLCAGLESAARLVTHEVDPILWLKHGLPAAARAGPADFATNLRTLEAFFLRLARHQVLRDQSFGDALQTALHAPTRSELESGLQVFETLITRLTERHLLDGVAPGLAELTRQAISLRRYYEDFELVVHEAITSEYEYYDSYYGTSYTGTQVDYPRWAELLPSGRRRTPLPLALLNRARIEGLLAQRAWLWRDEASRPNRERAIERAVRWRAYLPAFLDRLMRQGVLDPATPMISVYLIGSYPWVAAPNDLDLFLVVGGARDAAYWPAAALTDKGVQLPEFLARPPAPGYRSSGHDAAAPVLPHGISVEIVGHDTLLQASQGERVTHAAVLARRYALLYGSVLLGGDDLFEATAPPIVLLKELQQDLLNNMERADWPELAGDTKKIAAKKAWRKREADALVKFIKEQVQP